MIWFTADTHFGHANVLRFTDRHERWGTIEEMDRALVANINSCVGPNDDLYVLGDFSYKLTTEQAQAIREQIRCKNVHLVPGNHDKDWTQPDVAGTFIVEPPIAKLRTQGLRLVLCHYPIVDWEGLGHGSIHLHGHIHAPSAYNEWNRANRVLRYDVGVDANGYMPVSLGQIRAFFKGVEHRHRVTREQWLALAHVGEMGDGAAPTAPESAGELPTEEQPPEQTAPVGASETGTAETDADALLPEQIAPTAAELDAEPRERRR